ncbi:alanine--tRNA ligase [Leptolyngbya sp. FACHB-261]|uniref:alanine--tRNA ligase n=1 Tax=Leptolyngbya sp. FACHB-261 TaxID=2692806 RepID=UPI00168A2653|nr:alanine--tRNA ligase [Leptolyngbya sp. FACHB-261]MBD2103605.1 alanine--tRNA ligase [Leptolyngbya sp. FACHB-261]
MTNSASGPLSLSGSQIRQKFLDFYARRGHAVLPSASLVPEDPTVLLTIAGMLPFKPIFLGQQEPAVPRATTSQKCVRTNDIENVGRTARHHTFFEMLGNFSFGDYFKRQAIPWAWQLLTDPEEGFGLPPERLVVSVFKSDLPGVDSDTEAAEIWRDVVGIPEHRIQHIGASDNFWKSGDTGPCGPCSEIYYDFKPEAGDDSINLEDDSRFLEIYNLVFMELNRDSEGSLTPLKKQNIDTGLGLERLAQVLQGVANNYETDLIFPIIQTAAQIAGVDYHQGDERTKTSLKVIGDHVRSVVHMIADEIRAENVGRGYVLRRLIRRVVRHGRLLGIERVFTPEVAETAIALSETAYPQVRAKETAIKAELQREEERFLKTLERGEKLLAEILERPETQTSKQITGLDAFTLFDTYGFPVELTQEIAEEEGLSIDVAGYERELEQARERSRDAHETVDLTVQGSLDSLAASLQATEFTGYKDNSTPAAVQVLLVGGEPVQSACVGTEVQVVLDQTPFYAESGGQIGDRGYLLGDAVVVRVEDVKKDGSLFVHFGRVERGELKVGDPVTAQIDLACRRRAQAHHTATHLLQAALKQLIDANIGQAGSLVAFDRLRFDYTFNRPLTPAEIQQIEEQVNLWISETHSLQSSTMALTEAKAKGAVAMFGEKYGEQVRVIDVPGVSMELCGGTHVNNTAEIGLFKIVAETGVASGIRRIEAIAGSAVLEYLTLRDSVVRDLSDRFKVKPEEIPARITSLQEELKGAQKQLEALKSELAIARSETLLEQAQAVGDFKVLVANLGDSDPEALKTAAERLLQKLGEGAVILGSVPEADKVSLVAAFSPSVIKKGLQAGKFIGGIARLCGGGGGGRPNLAQAGGREPSKLKEALEAAWTQLSQDLS